MTTLPIEIDPRMFKTWLNHKTRDEITYMANELFNHEKVRDPSTTLARCYEKISRLAGHHSWIHFSAALKRRQDEISGS